MEKNRMIRSVWIATALGGLMLTATALAGDLKSGPAVGKSIPGPFKPLHCSGADAGDDICLV
jgi:hypothetical protein